MKFIILSLVMLVLATAAHASENFQGDIYCETGDPSGRGPTLDLKVVESGETLAADIFLAISSKDPLSGRRNIRSKKLNARAENSGNETFKVWAIPVSRAYQVRLKKQIDRNDSYWGAEVESRAGKFEPIQLGCQVSPN